MTAWRVVLLLLVAAATVHAVAPPINPPPSVIARWVRDLGSDEFARREEASRLLGGLDVVPAALEQATRSADPEVRRRAARALEQVRHNAKEKELARLLALLNTNGVDLTLDTMVLRKGAATDQAWQAIAQLSRGLQTRASALGWAGVLPAEQDFLALSVQRNLPLGGATRARILIDRPDDTLANVVTGCLLIAAGPVGRINSVENSVLLLTGDIEAINGARNSVIFCTGTIGSLNWTENCVVVARRLDRHTYSRNTLFEVDRLGPAGESVMNVYVNRKDAPAKKRSGDRFLSGVKGLWDQVRLFDPSRAGFRPGDRGRMVNGKPVADANAFRGQLRRALAEGEAVVEYERAGKVMRVRVRRD